MPTSFLPRCPNAVKRLKGDVFLDKQKEKKKLFYSKVRNPALV